MDSGKQRKADGRSPLIPADPAARADQHVSKLVFAAVFCVRPDVMLLHPRSLVRKTGLPSPRQ
jgi:hypothetical protein